MIAENKKFIRMMQKKADNQFEKRDQRNNLECAVCGEEKAITEVRTLECGHFNCSDCIRAFAMEQL